MELDVAFVPPESTCGAADVAVVIDVLRMTTTAATLFSRNLEELIVMADSHEALALAAETGDLLLGERGGLPLPGFHGGNSPLEHSNGEYRARTAILCTTNGSKAVEAVSDARHVLLGAIANARAVAERVAELDSESVLLVCAGTHGRLSLDDVVGAGCIAAEIVRIAPDAVLTDAAKLALGLVESGVDVTATLWRAGHAESLRELGFAEDVEFAARRNSLFMVPEKLGSYPARFRSAGGA